MKCQQGYLAFDMCKKYSCDVGTLHEEVKHFKIVLCEAHIATHDHVDQQMRESAIVPLRIPYLQQMESHLNEDYKLQPTTQIRIP
jgi:hypothetical protein